MELRETIKQLSRLNGPSGFEDSVRSAVTQLLEPCVDEVKTDVMGNVFGLRRCGREGAKTLLLDAHMDEIGLIVTGYEKGFLRFGMLGGVDRRMLPAREVIVMADVPLRGVIDTMPPHVLSAEEMDKAIAPDKLFINVGLSQEEAERLVPLGTPVVFAGDIFELGADQLCGKALDDRACAAIILKIMEELRGKELNVNVCAMLSTQEEVGTRGAAAGVFSAAPDWAIAIDVTHGKTPDAKDKDTCEMHGGPAIAVGPNMNRAFTREIFAAGEKLGMKCQTEVIRGNSGTNAWPMQISRAGVATAVVSLPLKYMHTPIETVSVSDAEDIVRLLTEVIISMDGEGPRYA